MQAVILAKAKRFFEEKRQQSMKSKAMQDMLDSMAQASFGRSRSESIQNSVCVCCGQPAESFKDEISQSEYQISGFCQNCQASTFDSDE